MKQYCIIGTGRSGSSFLANIMALSGADFQMAPLKEWNAVKGSGEHPLASKAFSYVHKLHTIESGIIPNYFFRDFFEKKLYDTLCQLKDIQYIKSSKLVYVVPHLAKLNAELKVVIIYRDFAEYAKSRHAKYGWDIEKMSREYCNAYGTALIQLGIWGGVVLSFDDLRDNTNTIWAESLSELTGLAAEDLLKNRQDILKGTTFNKNDGEIPVSDKVIKIQCQLAKLKNMVL